MHVISCLINVSRKFLRLKIENEQNKKDHIILFVFPSDQKRIMATPSGEKRSLRRLFKIIIADAQYKIESEKKAIQTLMQYNYKEEYSRVLEKMSRFCNTIKNNEEIRNINPMNVPEEIFEVDITDFFEKKGLNFSSIYIKPMDEHDTKEYAGLFPLG